MGKISTLLTLHYSLQSFFAYPVMLDSVACISHLEDVGPLNYAVPPNVETFYYTLLNSNIC